MPILMALYGFLLLGILGSTHCLGMCSPISTGLGSQAQTVSKVFLFNWARVLTYGCIGYMAGVVAVSAQSINSLLDVQLLFSLVSGLMTLMLGSYVLNIWNGLSFFTKLAGPVWKIINSVFRKIFPLNSFLKVFFAGTLWGFLPCGLVYSAAIASMELMSPGGSFFALIVFGIGTLPANVGLGLLGQKAKIWTQKKFFQKVAGTLLVIWGIIQIVQTLKMIYPTSQMDFICDLSVKECTQTLSNEVNVKVKVSPLPIKALQKTVFEVEFDTSDVKDVVVFFEGVDMDMGYNEMPLQNDGRIWKGSYLLPICSPKEMIWRMRVQVYFQGANRHQNHTGNENIIESMFYFVTRRDL